MRIAYWDSGDPEIYFDNPNLHRGDPGLGSRLGFDQREELERLQALDEISAKLAVDSSELARVVLGRCEELLEGTARVIRRFADWSRMRSEIPSTWSAVLPLAKITSGMPWRRAR